MLKEEREQAKLYWGIHMAMTGLDAAVQLLQMVLLILIVAQNVTLRTRIDATSKKLDGK
jgi:hypothetical protein